MRNIFNSLILVLIIEALFEGCANPGSITGGPKDTIPPKLILADPLDQTLNYKGQTITLTFDEFIAATKLRQSLIITPITEIQYKHVAKKQTVILKFEEPFEDSTTYTLNFFDGITDITEKNPAENLVIAFSTGDYIDSLEVFGTVRDLFSDKPIDKMTVGIYRITDSLNIFSNKPTYFINTDEYGIFRIQNIKNNKYRLIAFKDENKNLLFDAKETYSFLADTLDLKASIADSIELKALQINAAPLKLISGRPSTRYFEVRYSKPLTDYRIIASSTKTPLASKITSDKESIRFYNSESINTEDSVFTILNVFDSLKNQTTDTLYVKFRESGRKTSDFTSSVIPPGSKPIFNNIHYGIKFNKPIEIVDSSFISMRIDTLYSIPLQLQNLRYNFNQTSISFDLPQLTKEFITDTLESIQNSILTDTINVDSIELHVYNQIKNYPRNKFELEVSEGSFISVEKDTSENITAIYSFGNNENFGTIMIKVNSDLTDYIVQLMKAKDVYKELTNCTSCQFNQVAPGDYWVRVLIDENKDGVWSIGNILNSIEPEPVFFFPDKTSIRANWENELDITF